MKNTKLFLITFTLIGLLSIQSSLVLAGPDIPGSSSAGPDISSGGSPAGPDIPSEPAVCTSCGSAGPDIPSAGSSAGPDIPSEPAVCTSCGGSDSAPTPATNPTPTPGPPIVYPYTPSAPQYIYPPTINIKANNSDGPVSIAYGASAYLNWSGSNAYSCWASGDWSGLKSDFGSAQTEALTNSKTYTISCYGQAGAAVDSVTVNVVSSSPNIAIKKSVRNISRNTPYQETVYAFPSEALSFKIEIESLSAQTANNVMLRDILPGKIIYQGNLRAGGQPVSGDLISGLSLGILNLNQKKEITFDAQVAPKSEFISGLIVLTNQAGIRADNFNETFDPAAVNVNNLFNQTSLAVSKLAKNITKSDETWKQEIDAEPGDTLQMQIKITNAGNIAVSDVKIKDIMPSKITYLGDLTIDGQGNSQDIRNGINLGTVSGNQTKTLIFNVKLADKNDFSYGLTELINVANIYDGDFSLFDTAKINVTKKQVAGATDIITGINVFHISLMIAFILSLALYFIIFYLENSKNSLVRKTVRIYYRIGSFILR